MATPPSNGSGPFSFPLFSGGRYSYLMFPQMHVNGSLLISPLLEFGRSQAKLASKCGHEIARFTEQRLDRDAELLKKMTSSQQWQDVAELHSTWAAQAVKEYMQETGQLLDLVHGAYSEVAAASGKAGNARKPHAASAA